MLSPDGRALPRRRRPTVWEREPLEGLARDGELSAYRHDGFWQPMDTLRDMLQLQELWDSGEAPWKRMDVDAGVLARPARPRHRPHRLQGHLAVALAASLGAEVTGLLGRRARPSPSLFELARVGETLRDDARSTCATPAARPAALVEARAGGRVPPGGPAARARARSTTPRETYEINVMGTVNVLEAVRAPSGVRAVVNVTSDKCYENREWEWAYREDEPMGGHDPYSSSQGRVGAGDERVPALVLLEPDGPRWPRRGPAT